MSRTGGESPRKRARWTTGPAVAGRGVNRSDGHKDKSGNPVPGTYSEDNEMVALAEAIHAGGGGVIEIVSRFIFPSTCTCSSSLCVFFRVSKNLLLRR